ncbi:M56 family metallopeptidase [Psychroserpens luteolus]|uniref:M56 family metallopeptidase n=1 Tax=Psychroserpens luteolus TaxID=2855840 RepID=UPI001E4EC3BE|nr:M56 family metallopeptidase [Psychroserpens luteolus]MCD2257827.1 M56 family metallopeptidase [Psychroserpens luteolus]
MLIYILKFSACLTIFMVFYKLVLEKSSIHSFKRFYLLAALTLSLIIPSITFTEYIEPIASNFNTFEPIASFEATEIYVEDTSRNFTPIVLWSIYGLGVIIFLLKFSLNLYKIISRIKNNPKFKSERFINVLVTNLMIPHTFFSYIFLNKYKFEHKEIPKEVLLHEQTHAKQKHSIDVLIIEFLQIVFWFNPLIYLLKQDVKLNHEFLADRAVLNDGIQASAYQNIILAFSSKASDQQLANAINYSSIKKRFTVMKTKTSKTSIWLRSLFLLPLLAVLLYSFTNREQIVRDDSSPVENTILETSSEGVSDALMKEYNEFIIKFNTTHVIDYSKYERIVSIYNLMSDKQKASVEPYPKVPDVDLSKTKAKVPNKAQFESWKNEKEFAIWIDGVHVSNDKLNSYNVDDIAHYTGSFVHKNARSEKFPQQHQFSLYTKEDFKNTYQESKIKKYHALTEKYAKAIEVFLKGDRLDNSDLLILKDRCLRLYDSFSKEDIKKHNILPPPPPPAKRQSQQGATSEQIAEYNKMAKFLNDKSIKNRIIKVKDYKRLERIYKLMTKAQRANAEPFPKLPPPPPPPPHVKKKTGNGPSVDDYADVPPPPPIPENATPEQRKKMQNAADNYWRKQKADIKTGFIKINGHTNYYVSINGLTKYYNRQGFEISKNGKVISKAQVNASEVIPNQYVTKVYTNDILVAEFKDNNPSLKGELNIPPPPPPKSPLDHIIDMAKQDAIFYFNGKKITSDKAIQILKKDTSIHIQTIKDETNTPTILLSKKPIINNKAGLQKPTPATIEDHIKVMNRHGARFYLENKEMTYKDALAYVKKHKDADVSTSLESNVVKISPKTLNMESPLVFVIAMSKKNAKFFYKDKEITSNKAISLVKRKGGLLKIDAKNVDSKQPSVFITEKGPLFGIKGNDQLLVMINGKTPVNGQLTLSKKEFKDLKLTMKKLKVKSFKFKVPGKRTESISGNVLNDKSKSYVEAMDEGSAVQFFDIKSSNGIKLKPIVVTIK